MLCFCIVFHISSHNHSLLICKLANFFHIRTSFECSECINIKLQVTIIETQWDFLCKLSMQD